MHGWGWFGALVMTGVLLLIVAGAVALALALARPGRQSSPPDRYGSEADRLLDERFARGEIDEADYMRRRALLHGG